MFFKKYLQISLYILYAQRNDGLKVTYIKKVFSMIFPTENTGARTRKPGSPVKGSEMCAGARGQGCSFPFPKTCGHPVATARANPPTFSPGTNFQNEPTNLYFSHMENQPRRLPRAHNSCGRMVTPASPAQVRPGPPVHEAGVQPGGGVGTGDDTCVYRKEQQLLNIHSCVCHAFFFT